MLPRYRLRGASALRPRALPWCCRFVHSESPARRSITSDGRNRLSNFWAPAQRLSNAEADSHQILIRLGFLRRAHSGIFHLLPLGLRVLNKVESLIDRHMAHIGAQKVSLSSISSQELWQRSGRFEGRDSELFKLYDRVGGKLLLSPTHEEEITTLVADAVESYDHLPLRLYQVSRKYRDELRPRGGLLRGREFVMKDLYTFDVTEAEARKTYEQVRAAYCAFLEDLRIPYAVAEADSGNMGGKLSHEYHFISSKGEDTVISCDKCDMVLNDELYTGRNHDAELADSNLGDSYRSWHGITRDRKTSVNVYIPDGPHEINIHAIKQLVPDLDPGVQVEPDVAAGSQPSVNLLDPRLSSDAIPGLQSTHPATVHLTQLRTGDPCPRCQTGTVTLSTAVEIGHTFHLGTRYSDPLNATVSDEAGRRVSVEMGCHGIGISRLVGAVAALLKDSKGLNWPLKIAPFGIVVVGTNTASAEDLKEVYDDLTEDTGLDAVIDDREKTIGWKLHDADAIGYPFIVVLGRAWGSKRAVELQCRRLGVKEEVDIGQLGRRIADYSARL